MTSANQSEVLQGIMNRSAAIIERSLRRALRERNLEDAAGLLERLRRTAPLDLKTRGFELEYLLVAGRLDEAGKLAEQLVAAHPDSPRILYLAGRTAYASRRYAEALELLEEAGRLAPHWRIRLWIAKALTQLGRLDEAEPVLRELVVDHPRCAPDLAWLHERRGELDEAIRILERHIERNPDDRFAANHLEQLRARSIAPDRLAEQVEMLREYGEEIPPGMLAEYVESLLRTGRSTAVRELLPPLLPVLDPRTRLQIAWSCHFHGVPDVACSLFLEALPSRSGDFKLLAAIEKDARLAGRLDELLERYRELAPRQPQLWGRLRRLSGRRGGEAGCGRPAAGSS